LDPTSSLTIVPIGDCDGSLNAVATFADGSILAVGSISVGPLGAGSAVATSFAVVQLHEDGRVDEGFGRSGIIRPAFGGSDEWAELVLIQADQRPVIAGSSTRDDRRMIVLARLR
jgi:hypothetical protein